MVGPLLDAGVSDRVIDVVPDGDVIFSYPIAKILQVPLVHDVPNCGWFITLPNDETMFYATDTGTLDGIEAKYYDLYMIEANHTKSEIEARAKEKEERGEFSYERRAASNHLSYEQAMDFIARNAGPKSRYILLHHHEDQIKPKSEETNA